MRVQTRNWLGPGPPSPGKALPRVGPSRANGPAQLPGHLQVVGTSQDVWTPGPSAHSRPSSGVALRAPSAPSPPDHPESLIVLRMLTQVPHQDAGVGVGHVSCRSGCPSGTDGQPRGGHAFRALELGPSGTWLLYPSHQPGRKSCVFPSVAEQTRWPVAATLCGRSRAVGQARPGPGLGWCGPQQEEVSAFRGPRRVLPPAGP